MSFRSQSSVPSGSSILILFILCIFLWQSFILPTASYGFPPTADEQAPQVDHESSRHSVTRMESSPADILQGRVAALAEALNENLLHGDPRKSALANGLVVCTFVDLKKLSRTSSFGRYLAEQFMNAFQQQGYRVVELRKAKNVMVQERHGEYGLSREPAKISGEAEASAMLTGTYMPAGDQVVVNARIIDLRDGSLLSTAAVTFPRDRLLALLLRDSATASTGEEYVTTLKKLER